MTTPTEKDIKAARLKRRRRRQGRQTVIFGALITGMVVTGVVGGLVAAGAVSSPLTRTFTEKSTATAAPDPWCPVGDMMPVDPAAVTVRVYNGTLRSGLARTVQNSLVGRGFQVPEIGDYSDKGVEPTAQIHYGPDAANEAYTLARQIPDAVLWADDREGKVVDVVAGKLFNDLVPADELAADTPFTPPSNCRAVPVATSDE